MVRLVKEFRLDEISAVDYPAQEGARAVIMKRAPAVSVVIAKMGGAVSFDAAREAAESCDEMRPYTSELYKYWWALQSSIDSITSDNSVADKQSAIKESVAQFTAAANGVFTRGQEADDVADIAEITKRAEAAEAQVAELTKKLEAAEAIAKRADDEILKVGETEIRKSAVGAEMFAFAKAQNEALAKARDEAELSTLAKRASAEFGALPGTDIIKARILKAASAMPEEVAKALETALTAGNAAMKLGFEKRGVTGAVNAGSFSDKVAEIQKRDNISKSRAFEVAALEHPELVEEIR